jgi:hypothetical protein
MTAADLLSTLRARGVELLAHEGRLRWRPREAITPEERDLLTRHKAELLGILLAREDPILPVRPSTPSEPSAASWNGAEAARLLAALRAEVERVIRPFGSNVPQDLANVLTTWLEVAEGYVQDHEKEATRGLDVLSALRRLPEDVQQCLNNWKMINDARTRPL